MKEYISMSEVVTHPLEYTTTTGEDVTLFLESTNSNLKDVLIDPEMVIAITAETTDPTRRFRKIEIVIGSETPDELQGHVAFRFPKKIAEGRVAYPKTLLLPMGIHDFDEKYYEMTDEDQDPNDDHPINIGIVVKDLRTVFESELFKRLSPEDQELARRLTTNNVDLLSTRRRMLRSFTQIAEGESSGMSPQEMIVYQS